jgi:hypothetical protein
MSPGTYRVVATDAAGVKREKKVTLGEEPEAAVTLRF